MSQTETGQPELTGSVFLYEKPELLMKDKHGALGLSPASKPFKFASGVRAIPVNAREFAAAQRDYPIVFTNGETVQPLAVVGIFEDVNLFVDDAGQWERHAYIPAYLRRYPYAFANDAGNERMALVIDAGSEMVVENAQFPFFNGDKLSDFTEQAMEFCKNFEQERRGAEQLSKTLKDLDLLAQQEARYTPEGADQDQLIATYVGVEEKRLRDLPKDKFIELRDNGMLPLIYAQLLSMANWRRLLERRALRQQKPAAANA